MLKNLEQLIRGYEPWQVAIELLVIGVCVTIIVRFLKGTRGAGIIKGFAVLLVVGTLAVRVLGEATDAFARLNFIYDKFLTVVAILLIVVFQPELRQAMIRLGHAWSFRAVRGQMHSVVDAVSEAVIFLSKSQFGALIAIERSARLGGLIEGGIRINAEVSARLLESIFWPNNPLHDLGTIIRGNQVLAASVQFPLAEDGVLGPEFGSRHRAAAGLSLEADCLVIIVSEETGAISIAEHGRLEHDIPRDAFRAALARRLAVADAAAGNAEEPEPSGRNEKEAKDKMQAA
jgi:diadenylate cyclase